MPLRRQRKHRMTSTRPDPPTGAIQILRREQRAPAVNHTHRPGLVDLEPLVMLAPAARALCLAAPLPRELFVDQLFRSPRALDDVRGVD